MKWQTALCGTVILSDLTEVALLTGTYTRLQKYVILFLQMLLRTVEVFPTESPGKKEAASSGDHDSSEMAKESRLTECLPGLLQC